MRIRFHKISNDQHALEVIRTGKPNERVDYETRSFLTHDLLHYAVESVARLQGGFWGKLAQGLTIAEISQTAAMELKNEASELAQIEGIVGPFSALTKGVAPQELFAAMTRRALEMDSSLPYWLTESFTTAVQEKMRQLQGQWNATPFGGWMELEWLREPREGKSG